jgi:hypothetical protein
MLVTANFELLNVSMDTFQVDTQNSHRLPDMDVKAVALSPASSVVNVP